MILLAVNSIALVKPEKAKMVENMLCQMAQQGQLPGKVRSMMGIIMNDVGPVIKCLCTIHFLRCTFYNLMLFRINNGRQVWHHEDINSKKS